MTTSYFPTIDNLDQNPNHTLSIVSRGVLKKESECEFERERDRETECVCVFQRERDSQ